MKDIKTKLKTLLLIPVAAALSFSFAAVPAVVSAGDKCGDVDVSIEVGCSGSGNPIFDYAKAFMAVLSVLVGVVVVGAIAVGGIGYASASNDAGQVKKSIEIIRNAIIGLLLFIGMAAILNALVPGGLF